MRVFIWKGPHVLKRYGSGIVAVIARDEAHAWDRLKAETPTVWANLAHGLEGFDWMTADDVADELAAPDFERRQGFPIAPQAYDLDAAPVIYQAGSE